MTAAVPDAEAGLIAAQYEAAPGTARLRELMGSFAAAPPETVVVILGEAVRFAEQYLAGFGEVADRIGAILVDGRVRTAPGHRQAWAAYVAGGWPTLDIADEEGGQGLPTALACAVQEIGDRHCAAFGMVAAPTRSAARLIAAFASDTMHDRWMPMLASGEWTATIRVSEAEAGCDVMRADDRGDGRWSVTGEQRWIPFGDHDLAPRIGHIVLASTGGREEPSLFLVPNRLNDGTRNRTVVRRIEEGRGRHSAPACTIGFKAATGWLIGAEGRGLQQMAGTIADMRLVTGARGLGLAAAAADVALAHATERGPRSAIDTQGQVQRTLLDMAAKVEVLRGLMLATANQTDLATHETDAEARAAADALARWLLPILESIGVEFGFEVSGEAVRMLGAARHARASPVERTVRDARALTMVEGTTGGQALDFVHRHIRGDDGRGLARFLALARADGGTALASTLALLEAAARTLATADDLAVVDGGAAAMLRLGQLAATGWIAARLAALAGDAPATRRLRVAGEHWLADLTPRAVLAHAEAIGGAGAAERFAASKGRAARDGARSSAPGGAAR